MKKYIIISVILIFSFSCKKYGHGYIKGTVSESDTGNPIPNAKVTLGRWREHHISGSYVYVIIDSTFTDYRGAYSFKIDKERRYRYSIYCSNPNYYSSQDNYEINYKKSTHNFSLEPFGYIKLRIKKTTQSFTFFSGTVNYQPLDYFYNEMPFDTILPTVYKARGNATNYIDWSICSKQDWVPTVTMPRQQVFVGRSDTVLLFFQLN